MSKQINQYTKTRTSGTFQDDDLLDFDSTEDSGTSYESAKGTILQFINYIKSTIDNFYNSDGVLTGNRTVECSGNYTKFDGGDIHIDVNDEITDRYLLVHDISDNEVIKMGFDNTTDSGVLFIENTSGLFFIVDDGLVEVDGEFNVVGSASANVLYVDPASNRVGVLTGDPYNQQVVYAGDPLYASMFVVRTVAGRYGLNHNNGVAEFATYIDDAFAGAQVMLGAISNHGLGLMTNDTNRLIVYPNGDITIGPITTANARLQIRSGGSDETTFGLIVETSGGTDNMKVRDDGVIVYREFTVAALPPAVLGGVIIVTDETGGKTMATGDATNWRRVSDGAIVS